MAHRHRTRRRFAARSLARCRSASSILDSIADCGAQGGGGRPYGSGHLHHLPEYFPAAVAAFEDLDAPDTLELLGKAPDPASAAKLARAQVSAVLKRAGRYKIGQPERVRVVDLRIREFRYADLPPIRARRVGPFPIPEDGDDSVGRDGGADHR